MGPLTIEDVEPIARGQLGLETSYRETAGERATLIFDTDLLSTWVYAHHYYGAAPDWIDERLRRTSAAGALYLLCDTDLPWVEDPIRDRVAARQEIQARFRDQLIDRVLPFEALRGIGSDRLAAAIQAIDARFGSLSA
jgi:nicotinamide riboside kinase